MEAREALDVGAGGVEPSVYGSVVEEDGDHRADALHDARLSGVAERCREARFEPGSQRFQALVECGVEQLERAVAGSDGDGIAAQRARLIDRADGRDAPHDLGAATIDCEGHAAADDLAEARHVRLEPVALLGAALRDARPGHHFVEDRDGAVRAAEVDDRLEETGARRDETHVARDGLDNDGCDARPLSLEELLQRERVVVGRGHRRRDRPRGDPGGIR